MLDGYKSIPLPGMRTFALPLGQYEEIIVPVISALKSRSSNGGHARAHGTVFLESESACPILCMGGAECVRCELPNCAQAVANRGPSRFKSIGRAWPASRCTGVIDPVVMFSFALLRIKLCVCVHSARGLQPYPACNLGSYLHSYVHVIDRY